ncbi:hypothetical protein [Rhodovulum steppense]|uniref:Type IV pilus biogenesis protein PilP n=1 Tax=Rhodovulum steppense TaxID=540251 RepID=A0A4R1YWN6_9RHOB|nr:hypothetical protein [Rhodovulum steppense]TCM85183.1 hypothetical protein EV216_10834 [Rhodovulum steppense]
MKPGFALTLSEDGIGLLHRTRGGWRRLGDVLLDDPGLGETLRLMRGTAESLAGGRLLTKLVIPDSQVLYTTLPFVGDSPAEKRTSLRRGLDGLTPYVLDDLVFDWQEVGAGTARLAVVARETLAEAEAFATLHMFNPVCWVAAPPDDRFEGEAFFGPTALAATLLPKGETPEPEGPAAHQEGRAMPETGGDRPAASASTAARTSTLPAHKRKTRAEPKLASSSQPAAPAASTPPPSAPSAADPVETALSFASTHRPEDAPPAPADSRPPRATATTRLTLNKPDEPDGGDARTATSATQADIEEAVRAAPPPTPTTRAAPVSGIPTDPGRDAIPATPTAPRARPPSPWPLGKDEPVSAVKDGKLRLGLALTGGLVVVMAVVVLWSLLPSGEKSADAPSTIAESAAAPDTPSTGAAVEFAAQSDPTEEASDADIVALPALSETEAAESYATTGLWQLAPDPMTAPPPGRIDDLFVAALDPSIRPPVSSTLPDSQLGRALDLPLALQADPPGHDQVFVLDDRGLVAATPEGALTPDGVMVFAGQPPLLPRGRAADPAAAPEAVTAEIPEPAPADRIETAADAAAISEVPAAEAGGEDAGSGLAEATRGGEEGVTVIEGAPTVTPPERPEFVVPVVMGRPPVTPPERSQPEPITAPAEIETPTAPDTTTEPDARSDPEPGTGDEVRVAPRAGTGANAASLEADSAALPDAAALISDPAVATRLAAYRPRLRPSDLATEAQATTTASVNVPALRPAPRPAALAAAAPPPMADRSTDIEAALAAALAAEEAAADEAAESDLAIARSIRPSSRPSDLGSSTAPAIPVTAAAAAPRIPTTANVARQATVPKAINLRQINLIGVYGASGDRRALVRLANGRYEKVKVGDRLDGGRVAVIGENQLRYVKNGRNLVLDLPGR